MITFKELDNITSGPGSVTEKAEALSACAGSVFQHRAETLHALEVAKDNVKFVLADIEMEVHSQGFIPNREEGGKPIKTTGAAVKAYVDSHPRAVEARVARQEAEMDYDTAKGLATSYNAKKTYLELRMADQKNEWYSEPKPTAKYDSGLQEFDKK